MTTETITWIPVSERLPDTTDFVLTVSVVDSESYVEPAQCIYCQWLDWMGHPLPSGVTHWCEMPKGPQS